MNSVIRCSSAATLTTKYARYGLLLALMTGLTTGLLTGCGGGGGGGTTPSAPASSGGGSSSSGTNGGTVIGVQIPSNVAVVTAQNAG